jgi:two-component system, NarL family, nitrate/nitrite response regulator NarL
MGDAWQTIGCDDVAMADRGRRRPAIQPRSETPDRVRIIVAEDHPLYRIGLRRTLDDADEIEVVGEARDGAQALALVRGKHPDVAVVDVRMPEPDGLAIAEIVAAEGLPTRIVLLSAFLDGAVVHHALSAGAAGYLSKEEDEPSLVDAVLGAARGETVVSEGLRGAALEHVRHRASSRLLSGREAEVLELLAAGRREAEIAGDLGVSAETVHTYKKRLYVKLDVSGAAAAVAAAMRRGLLK